MATQTLSLAATRYKGTSVDTQVAGDYVGNVNKYGSAADHYRVRLAFTPTKTLSKVVLNLAYSGNTNPDNVTYRCGVFSSCPAKTSTDGTAFTWSSKAATITLTQTFTANTQYYIWVWSPSTTGGYVVLSSYTATGTVATYTVSYNANGGSGVPSSQTKDYGATLTLSSTKPTKADALAATYTATFNANGGSTSKASQNAKKYSVYTFSKWNTASDGSGTAYASGASYTANANATLYAQYSTTYRTESVTLPTTAQCTRSGYNLLGFATSSSATKAAYDPGAAYTPSSSVTLYAVWEAQGLVYVDTGTDFEAYQLFVDNENSCDQYAPFVDDVTDWVMLS